MSNVLPAELYLTIGPIAVLSLALAAVAVSYVFLLIKLGKSEKDKVFLQSKIRDHASDVLRDAHEKRLRILQEATETARTIINNTQLFSDEAKTQFATDLNTTRRKQDELLNKRSEEISKLYEQFANDVHAETTEQFKGVAKNMENYAITGIGEFKTALESEKLYMQKQLEVKVEEEYKKAQKNIEDYKIDQMKKVDKKVFDILHALIRDVLGKSLSLKDHEELVQKALAQMQTEMNT